MNQSAAAHPSIENLIEEGGSTIPSVAHDLRAKARWNSPIDAPFRLTTLDAVESLSYDDAIAYFESSCGQVTLELFEVRQSIFSVILKSLSLHLAAARSEDVGEVMEEFHQSVKRITGECAGILNRLLNEVMALFSTLCLYSNRVGVVIADEGEEMALPEAFLVTMDARDLSTVLVEKLAQIAPEVPEASRGSEAKISLEVSRSQLMRLSRLLENRVRAESSSEAEG